MEWDPIGKYAFYRCISSTEDGIIISEREIQFSKECEPMIFTVGGIVICFKELQSLKQILLILLIDDKLSIFSIDSQL